MSFTNADIVSVNLMLAHFGYSPCRIEDGIMYFDDKLSGLSIAIEERKNPIEVLTGTKYAKVVTYVLYGTYLEHNYPHAPDWEDIVELDTSTRCLLCLVSTAIQSAIKMEHDNYIEARYYESEAEKEAPA